MTNHPRRLFKDKEHLVRMAGIFAVAIAAFLGLQLLLVPETFGVDGHYRAAAVPEVAARPPVYAGRAVCATCHKEQADTKASGKHAALGCEGCHGALMRHALAPADHKPSELDARSLCASCHEASAGRPKLVRQVHTEEHSGGAVCVECHQPHSPQMGGGPDE